jgi:hypothetical protein
VLNPQRLLQQAAQFSVSWGAMSFNVKNQCHISFEALPQAKIAGRFWRTNQKRTGNCECTRATGATQEKVSEKNAE